MSLRQPASSDNWNGIVAAVALFALVSVAGCSDHVIVDPAPGINGTAERLAVGENSSVTHVPVEFSAALSEAEASGKTLVVDFGAAWCGPCRMLKPEMEKVAGRLQDKAIVLTVDVDHELELTAHFQVGAIPDVRFFQHGKAAGGVIGFHTAEQIIAKLPSN
ncbi:MAG: thioredoxin family protein [Fuerstiella sp.]|nr:thioredoxin family protein [Fuerstiella sp.]MCP4853965.1 thioredoxin family protein [Fuerstiella sp.]